MQRLAVYRSESWLDAVRALPECVRCQRNQVEAAHRNQGKGEAQKVDDCAVAALCRECHHEIDHGKNMTREQRRTELDRCIVLTTIQLARRGHLAVSASPMAEPSLPARPSRRSAKPKGSTASPSKSLAHPGVMG